LTFNGDGIGPEIVGAAKQCIEATGVGIEWTEMEMVDAWRKRHDEIHSLTSRCMGRAMKLVREQAYTSVMRMWMPLMRLECCSKAL
jgi:isocitrate/isopropylmalate dehydrogenase